MKSRVDISAIAYDENLGTVSVQHYPDCMVGFSTF